MMTGARHAVDQERRSDVAATVDSTLKAVSARQSSGIGDAIFLTQEQEQRREQRDGVVAGRDDRKDAADSRRSLARSRRSGSSMASVMPASVLQAPSRPSRSRGAVACQTRVGGRHIDMADAIFAAR